MNPWRLILVAGVLATFLFAGGTPMQAQPALPSAEKAGAPLGAPTFAASKDSSLASVGSLLVGTLLLLTASVWIFKNGLPWGRKGSGNRNLNLLETKMLGARQYVAVVAYEHTKIMLGVSAGRIEYLCTLPTSIAEEDGMAEIAPPASTPKRASPARFSLSLCLGFLLLCSGVVQASEPFTFSAGSSATSAPLPPPSVGSSSAPLVNLQLGGGAGPQQTSSAIQIVGLMTLLTLAPSLVMMMTSFTRLVIVLGFVRSALGIQGAPANQIIIGISLFLTFFIMAPVAERIYSDALQPYMAGNMDGRVAMEKAEVPLREFMLRQTRPADAEFFLDLNGTGPVQAEAIPLRAAIPAFIISELRTAFQMGFLIFVPFLLIDFIVSSTLMSMGMMMMPPVVVSLPFKLLLFVLVDGWQLIIRSLVQSFAV